VQALVERAQGKEGMARGRGADIDEVERLAVQQRLG
jgi:hypothetical protein